MSHWLKQHLGDAECGAGHKWPVVWTYQRTTKMHDGIMKHGNESVVEPPTCPQCKAPALRLREKKGRSAPQKVNCRAENEDIPSPPDLDQL